MKKNIMMRIASVLLIAVLMTTCVISGTFAKYTSTSTGSSTARVAKWDIQLEGAAWKDSVTFDLFGTIKDDDGSTAETNVADGGDSANIIAPGTSGQFVLDLENKSEVTASYSITLSVKNDSNIPIQFSTDNGQTWSSTISNAPITGNLSMSGETAKKSITVQWKWVYENGTDTTLTTNDKADTTLGIAGNAEVTVTASITATQVD